MARRVIAITGIPGAYTNCAAAEAVNAGYSILWPGQDRTLEGVEYDLRDGVNHELAMIHVGILEQAGQSWYTTNSPLLYDPPMPGPPEYMSKFPPDDRIILSDMRLCLFLPLWREFITDLVICEFPLDVSGVKVFQWCGERSPLDECTQVAHHYKTRLTQHRGGFDRTLVIPSDHMLSGQYKELLASFLRHGGHDELEHAKGHSKPRQASSRKFYNPAQAEIRAIENCQNQARRPNAFA